ncbi:MAG: hypothetical protein J0L94_09815 [Rhodothermia bacterium]|nr:hypothetical protein [Rhodothermia bacterium]
MLFIYSEKPHQRLPEKRPFSFWRLLGFGLVGLLNGGIIGVFFATYLAGADPTMHLKTAQLIISYFCVLGLGVGLLVYGVVHVLGQALTFDSPPPTNNHPPEWDLSKY